MHNERNRIQNERYSKSAELQKRIRYATNFYTVLGMMLVLVALVILGATIVTATTNAKAWESLNANMQRDNKISTPLRGNIYSDEDNPLAISVPRYDIRIDFKAGGFKDSLFLSNVDSLSHQLARVFHDRNASDYKHWLMKGYNQKSRSWRVVAREISHLEYLEVQKMAYLNIPNRNASGMVASSILRRVMPYGSLAQRTIGNLKRDADPDGITHGSSGLEMAFDSVLVGKPGLDRMIFIPPQWIRDPITLPINGMNIYTTLNVDIQDIAERSLRETLSSVNADWGCAVVMEVKTGAIKAIANLDHVGNGRYQEWTNHALADLLEPGSTFKAISMLTALNAGFVDPNDTIDVGNGLYHFARGLTIRDHNAHKGGYGRISAAQSIWYSSNVGVAKVILKGFGGQDQKFLDALNRMNVFDQIKLEIPGTTKPNIKQDVSKWSNSTMPWVSFGYEVQMPPIYTLRFYNAVANGGKMMEPYLVRSVASGKKIFYKNGPKVINNGIASKRAIEQLKEMLRGVVTDGTGKAMDSPHVQIAGKTGTAQLMGGGAYGSGGHNVTFCGYFPAEKPLYSCIVVVSRPKGVYPSGAIPGKVLRDIAEQTVAHINEVHIKDVQPDSLATFDMVIASGMNSSVRKAIELTHVKRKNSRSSDSQPWLVYQNVNDSVVALSPYTPSSEIMPNMKDMSAMDAVFMGEQLGLKVVLSGRGALVQHQSIPVGQKIQKGRTLLLTLR